MKRLITAIALIGLAIPAQAAECGGGNIEWTGTTPGLVDSFGDGSIRFDLVGQFVNYAVDYPDGDLASAEVPHNAVAFVVCPDGVTFETAAEPVVRTPDPAQLIVDVDADVWDRWQQGIRPE